VVVQESATEFIGRLTGFTVSRRGHYYLTDATAFTVLEISKSGEVTRRFGTRGQGPGELTRPTHVVVLGDSSLVVLDGRRMVAYSLGDRRPLWHRTLPRQADGLSVQGARILLPALDAEQRTSIIAFGGAADSMRRGGPFPHPYGQHPPIDATFGFAIRVAPLQGDTLVYAYHANEFLYWGPLSGGPYDSLRIARRHRNGAPPGVIAAAARDLSALQENAYALSAPWVLAPFSGGRIAYVAVDQRLLPGRLAGTLFVSVVDRRTGLTCPDARIPIEDDPPGYVAFVGDTLVVAHQDETRERVPRTIIRRFLVGTGGCAWTR
jgi:hypothetical protein